MSKPKLTVTLPDGTTASRRTDRPYTHVLVAKGGKSNEWHAVSWHGAEHLAGHALTAFLGRLKGTYQTGPGERWYVEPGSPRLLPVNPY